MAKVDSRTILRDNVVALRSLARKLRKTGNRTLAEQLETVARNDAIVEARLDRALNATLVRRDE